MPLPKHACAEKSRSAYLETNFFYFQIFPRQFVRRSDFRNEKKKKKINDDEPAASPSSPGELASLKSATDDDDDDDYIFSRSHRVW